MRSGKTACRSHALGRSRGLQPPLLIFSHFRQKCPTRCISAHIPAYLTSCNYSKVFGKRCKSACSSDSALSALLGSHPGDRRVRGRSLLTTSPRCLAKQAPQIVDAEVGIPQDAREGAPADFLVQQDDERVLRPTFFKRTWLPP